jgi:hypothetical protein
MFAKPMFSMLVWSYCVNGHLNSNGHEAAITSSAAKIGGTGKTLNDRRAARDHFADCRREASTSRKGPRKRLLFICGAG